jgi:acyl carrier protein
MKSQSPETARTVLEIIADAAGKPAESLTPDVELSSLGMGSLEMLECVLNIEDALKVEMDEPDLRKLRTVQDVLAAVRRATDAAGARRA